MSDESIESYLNEHIPYRMSIIDAFCMTMMQHLSPAEMNGRRIGFASNEVRFETFSGSRFVPMSEFTNLTIEAGLIASRTMMQFFGVTHDPKNPNAVKEYTCKMDDFTFSQVVSLQSHLTTLRVQRLNTVIEFRVFPVQYPFVLARDINLLLRNANKAAGHLTNGEKPVYGIDHYCSAISILTLVEDLVYHQCGRHLPYYTLWTDHLLEPPVLLLHGKMKRKLRDFLRKSVYLEIGL